MGVGYSGSQEPYNSVSTRSGTMYGYGTFQINSATTATWNMFENAYNGVAISAYSIDNVLICNSWNTGSAICPYATIPVDPTTTYVLTQVD